PVIESPWAPPGTYTVRLTVDGAQYTQPIRVVLDPRVTTNRAALTQLATVSRELWRGAHATHVAQRQARALSAMLANVTGADVAAFRAQVDSLAPASPAGGRPRGRRRGAGTGGTLIGAAMAMMSAANTMQGADVAPTAAQLAAAAAARAQQADVMAQWTTLHTTRLAALNAARKSSGQQPIMLPAVSTR
ncbi:MAG TPA: hypothetical protein VE861_05445, partial [Gemmatimonadaceae bacterium]|nr:hypothetical protein [Gemmatimonadaceae bacterium]